MGFSLGGLATPKVGAEKSRRFGYAENARIVQKEGALARRNGNE